MPFRYALGCFSYMTGAFDYTLHILESVVFISGFCSGGSKRPVPNPRGCKSIPRGGGGGESSSTVQISNILLVDLPFFMKIIATDTVVLLTVHCTLFQECALPPSRLKFHAWCQLLIVTQSSIFLFKTGLHRSCSCDSRHTLWPPYSTPLWCCCGEPK